MSLCRSKRKAVESQEVLSKKTTCSAAPKVSNSKPSTEESDDDVPVHRVWLDALPQDICCRIAAYITRDRDTYLPQFMNEDALALAVTSPKQKSAMAKALDHTPDLRYGDIKSWLEVFDHPTHIDAREVRGNPVLELLSRSSLRFARVSNRTNQFTAITAGNSVADLSIHVERLTDARFTTMLRTLKKLTQLVSLAIICNLNRSCAFEYIIDGHQAYHRLANSCPRLTTLHMICQCDTEVDHSPVAEAFPSLKEITVAKPLPDASLPYMRSRESVVLQSYHSSLCSYASKIGAAVTGIKFPAPVWSCYDLSEKPLWMTPVSEEEVAMLQDCPRLRELELLLDPGAEQALPESKLLISLQLHWSLKNRGNEEKAWPVSGSLVRRVFAQPSLQKISLVGPSIPIEDLEVVLRTAGKSLKELMVSTTGQPESILNRTLAVLDKVILHNDNLRAIRMVEPDCISFLVMKYLLSQAPLEEQKDFLVRFRQRVRKLQRKNPWYDQTPLLNSIRLVISHCEFA